MYLIDAVAIEREGWYLNRIIQTDKNTMEYQTKKPTEFPAIEPKRKPGKWINHRNDNGHNIADCSECGETLQWFDDDIKPNFCPNCGAKMGGCAI